MSNNDPFQSESAPALSFKDAAIGTVQGGVVTKPAELLQSRDFESGEPATWPDGNPKMSAVVSLDVDGEPRSVWAPKPSALFNAIGTATKALGRPLRAGDKLEIKYTGTKPNAKNPKLNAQKLYAAKVTPGAETTTETDPFVESTSITAKAAASTTENEPAWC